MSYKRYALGAVSALMLLAAGQAAQAQTLSSLLGGGTISSGGMIFSNFTYGGTLPASNVTVTGTATGGLQFTANWNTLTPGSDLSVIMYDVTVNPQIGGTLVSGSLSFAGHVIINDAAADVGETLIDLAPGTGGPYNLHVFYDGPGGLADNLTDTVNFAPPVTSLHVTKSIDLEVGPNGGFAALNFVDNTFVQQGGSTATPPVPEPMSLALLPLALAGLGLRKRLAR
jgi:hypothetical protein